MNDECPAPPAKMLHILGLLSLPELVLRLELADMRSVRQSRRFFPKSLERAVDNALALDHQVSALVREGPNEEALIEALHKVDAANGDTMSIGKEWHFRAGLQLGAVMQFLTDHYADRGEDDIDTMTIVEAFIDAAESVDEVENVDQQT